MFCICHAKAPFTRLQSFPSWISWGFHSCFLLLLIWFLSFNIYYLKSVIYLKFILIFSLRTIFSSTFFHMATQFISISPIKSLSFPNDWDAAFRVYMTTYNVAIGSHIHWMHFPFCSVNLSVYLATMSTLL